MNIGIVIGILAGLIGGIAVLINAIVEQKTCPNCSANLPRFQLREGWTCQSCGTEIDRHGNKIEKAAIIPAAIADMHSAAPMAEVISSPAQPAMQINTRRNWGCMVTVLGALFLLFGIVALLVIGAFSISSTAAQALEAGDTDQIIVPLLTCPLPLLLVGGAVFYLGRRLGYQSK
jgi:hypothetical protein